MKLKIWLIVRISFFVDFILRDELCKFAEFAKRLRYGVYGIPPYKPAGLSSDSPMGDHRAEQVRTPFFLPIAC